MSFNGVSVNLHLLYIVPTKSCKPMTPNRINRKVIKTAAFINCLSEATKVPTSYLILGMAFTLLRGLRALKFLRAFKLIELLVLAN